MPIRILYLVSNLEYGGAQRQLIELANHIDRERFEVRVCSLSNYVPLADRLRTDIPLHINRRRAKLDFTVAPRLVRLLKQHRIDVIHSYLFDANIAARLAGALVRTPIIVINTERNADYPIKRRHLIAYQLTRWRVDRIVANSRSGAVFNARKLGHDPSLYRVVHNGVDLDRFRPRDSGSVRRKLGFSEDERVVGMFASFKPQKNHALFLRASRHVVDRIPATRLLLVGDELYGGMHGSTDCRRDVERLADELQLRDRCVFTGNRDDVESLYCVCDVTVLPSLFEGTPNTVLESMACGVPVVVSKVSDNCHIVRDRHVGYVVPLGDEQTLANRVCTLLLDESARRVMGRAAREWVAQEFSITIAVRKTERIYVELLRREREGCQNLLAENDGGSSWAEPSGRVR